MGHENARGEPRFKHISSLAVSLLSLPFSNASVERAFSIANVVKDKFRNRMAIETLDAILRIRFLIKSCTDFEPTPKMIEMFTSENVYNNNFVYEILEEL